MLCFCVHFCSLPSLKCLVVKQMDEISNKIIKIDKDIILLDEQSKNISKSMKKSQIKKEKDILSTKM